MKGARVNFTGTCSTYISPFSLNATVEQLIEYIVKLYAI